MTASRLSRPISAFTRNFNAHERRLVVQVAVIGLVVWAVTFTLKTSVHWLFDTIIAGVERLPVLALVLVPLTLGALGTTVVVLFHYRTIHYRDREGIVHPLNDVEGDGGRDGFETVFRIVDRTCASLLDSLQTRYGNELK